MNFESLSSDFQCHSQSEDNVVVWMVCCVLKCALQPFSVSALVVLKRAEYVVSICWIQVSMVIDHIFYVLLIFVLYYQFTENIVLNFPVTIFVDLQFFLYFESLSFEGIYTQDC